MAASDHNLSPFEASVLNELLRRASTAEGADVSPESVFELYRELAASATPDAKPAKLKRGVEAAAKRIAAAYQAEVAESVDDPLSGFMDEPTENFFEGLHEELFTESDESPVDSPEPAVDVDATFDLGTGPTPDGFMDEATVDVDGPAQRDSAAPSDTPHGFMDDVTRDVAAPDSSASNGPPGFMDAVTRDSNPQRIPQAKPGSPDDPLIGELVHLKYRVKKCIGRGGFGAVYEAEDERGAGNRVAIKILSGRAAQSVLQRESFREEARRVTKLNHPNVVEWKVFDVTNEGLPYFVMELIDGEELHELLMREKRLPPARAANIMLQILAALRAAHHVSDKESILHLDLKPKNVFVTPARLDMKEGVKVIDFGIGQAVGETEEEQAEIDSAADELLASYDPPTINFGGTTKFGSGGSSNVARTSACTPEYAAPEHASHALGDEDIVPLDGRADLYSLGVIGYQLLTGKLPFVAKDGDRMDVLRRQRDEAVPSVMKQGVRVPRKLGRFIDRCLHKDRDQRFTDTEAAYKLLSDIVEPPVWKTVAAVTLPLILLAAGLGGWLLSRPGAMPILPVTTVAGASLEDAPLYLGATATTAELDLAVPDDHDGLALDGEWQLLVDAEEGAVTDTFTDAFKIERTDRGVRVVVATPPAGRIDQRVVLDVDNGRARSRSFRLIWIGQESWALQSLRIDGKDLELLGTRAIDPDALYVEFGVLGAARGDVSVARARLGTGPWVDLGSAPAREGQRRFRAALADMQPTDGDTTLRVEFEDPTGFVVSQEWPLRLETRPLAIAATSFVDRAATIGAAVDKQAPQLNRLAGRSLLTSKTQPELRVELNRPATLQVSVLVDGDDTPALQRRLDGQRRFALPLTELATLANGSSYSGRLVVTAEERDFVHHRAGSTGGIASLEIPFGFDNATASVSERWLSQSGATLRKEQNDGRTRVHSADPRVRVLISRDNDVPMHVRVSNGAGVDVLSTELADLDTRSSQLDFTLPRDGVFALRLQSFRCDSTGQAAKIPDMDEAIELVLDREAPQVQVSGIVDGHLVTPDQPFPVELESSIANEAKATLSWTLTHESGTRGAETGNAIFTAGESGSALAFSVARPWEKGRGAADGRYRLDVSSEDAAGNRAEPVTVRFEVALHGPRVAIEEPSGVGRWHAASDGRWPLRLAVSDPNGVASVQATVVADRATNTGLQVDLEKEVGSNEDTQVSSGSVVIPYEWSNRSVHLRIVASDEHGATTELLSEALQLPTIERPRPQRVSVRRGTTEATSMRLVAGNASFPYLFGGRGDRVENLLFVEAGLAPFNKDPRRAKARSWQIEFAPGTIADFYLDEREVTVQQFLSFLDNATGYAAFSNDRDRAHELRRSLAEMDRDAAVVGVTWDEASHYARWVGKRLPTWLEWEYTLRGGALYRAVADDREIAGLSSGVAEWTQSPLHYDPQAVGSPRESALKQRALIAEPHEHAALDPHKAFWVAGVRGNPSDFSAVEYRPRSTTSNVGFRCAISLSTLEQSISNPDETTFEETSEEMRR
ncbi:MAG: bifunctional serine/threonine-protein kinase/formylglycine-generating enzyme family protein [Planctomycetota bacterium]